MLLLSLSRISKYYLPFSRHDPSWHCICPEQAFGVNGQIAKQCQTNLQ